MRDKLECLLDETEVTRLSQEHMKARMKATMKSSQEQTAVQMQTNQEETIPH
jgi:hypothetical protein